MAPLYARYIPPKRPQNTNGVSQAEFVSKDSTAAATKEISVHEGNGRKKRKRSKDEATSNEHASPSQKPEQHSSILSISSISNGVHPERQKAIAKAKDPQDDQSDVALTKKSKKRRLAAEANGGPQDAANNSAADDSMSKHSAILKKFAKSSRQTQAAAAQQSDDAENVEIEQHHDLHDLVPLPQPLREPTPEYKATFSALPPWLEKPVSIASSQRSSFVDLGVGAKTAKHLADKGFTEAFAVQCALIPRLMYAVKHSWAKPNDVCVSAPTGSGKTLGYALPIVESLRALPKDGKLRAVVIVPTRELAEQAVSTFRKCMAGSQLNIATSIGNHSFAEEQAALVDRSDVLDPKLYARLMRKLHKRKQFEYDTEDDEYDDMPEAKLERLLSDVSGCHQSYVPRYSSTIDILVCTPGRLVEHLQNTLGFTLENLQWLVIDEADRLLDQSFQDWVRNVNTALSGTITNKAEEALLPSLYTAPNRYVRKVILSATMTRDISQLGALNLRRPTMVVVRAEHGDGKDIDATVDINDKGEYELPAGLSECVIPVGDGSEKPLYLLDTLKKIYGARPVLNGGDAVSDSDSDSDSDASSESATDSDSGSDSDGESSSSTSSSSGYTSSSSSGSDSEGSGSSTSSNPDTVTRGKASSQTSTTGALPQVLVFASSTSEAHRLHHLLSSLLPSILSPCPKLVLLTRSHSSLPPSLTKTSTTRGRIIISTDRASRGLDLPLTHVLNYTIPRSLESYVHRVGRTARAGRTGEAWSLVRDVEARWFWNEIARTSLARRGINVERKRQDLDPAWKEGKLKSAYQKALLEMREMVGSNK